MRLAINTFSTGFHQISERYIENISVADLAVEGLKGLAIIDPTIEIDKNRDTVSIKSSMIRKRLYTAPTDHDALGWAQLVVSVIIDGKNASITFEETKMARFYELIFGGSLSFLDVFSRYQNKEKAKKNREKRSGFGGIGIYFKPTQNGIIVTQVFSATPAFRAGIKLKDIITHIGKNSLAGLEKNNILDSLRGKIGSIIDIKILRPDPSALIINNFSPLSLSIKRGRIIVPTTSYSVHNGILYTKVSSFNNRTSKDLAFDLTNGLKAIREKSGKKALGTILDLRNNPGGLFKQAISVANLFLNNGRITSTKGRHPGSNQDYEAYGKDLTKGMPLVVLINGRSASAAEVVAAALQDHARGIIIGSTSFGKGTIQTVARLPNDGELAITWSRFRTPSGYFPHELGIRPSICVRGSKTSLANQYIQETLKQAKQIMKIRLAWYSAAISQKLERVQLRATCPPKYRKNSADIKISEELIHNAALFQQVKSLIPSILLIRN